MRSLPRSRGGCAGWFLALLTVGGTAMADFESTGLVQPVWEATLAPTVLGRVERILVKEADRVEAGAPLLYLERSFEELDAERRQIVLDSKVELELARAKVEVLRSQYESTRQLYESTGTVSKEEFERTRLDFKLAEAEMAQLEQREKIEALELKLAKEQVSNREIRAPRAGTVVEIYPEVGEVCEPRQPLLRLVDARTVRIDLEVDALRTAGISAGDEVPVLIEAPGGAITSAGKVEYVSPVVDGASGLRRIRITITNTTGKIIPGLSARVTFPAQS